MPQIINGKMPDGIQNPSAAKELVLPHQQQVTGMVVVQRATIVRYLLLAGAVLFLLHGLVVLAIYSGRADSFLPTWQATFYFDKEGNLPSFFSAFLLLLASLFLGLIAACKQQEKNFFSGYWVALALIFLFLGIDEAAGMHELVLSKFSNGHVVWGQASGAAMLVFATFYYQFYKSLNKATRRGFFVAGFCFLFGAVGLEMVGTGLLAQGMNDRELAFMLVMTLEEVFEMGSILYFVSVLLQYLKNYPVLGIAVK
ncbi:hypothetical protein FVR03_14185 [Pontibacter qinzhouensis]|uniref:DUF998 domain-containing protein n=1 Tax=Pontibacter qinzhouensis TaxID=2603253 RepID=A0A5C8JKY7_9BACT|nr:hypothetical protein [Pontibacter qinzhouensis]TXK38132.1 hypothetical protein FVR03_14185 [Pontibacter qinzhouensis]